MLNIGSPHKGRPAGHAAGHLNVCGADTDLWRLPRTLPLVIDMIPATGLPQDDVRGIGNLRQRRWALSGPGGIDGVTETNRRT
jgi:hypothetical protein